MKLSTWRPGLISWLESKITIDNYYLDLPEFPGQTVVTLPPLRNIKNYESDDGLHATATQDIYITTRYSKDLAYYQLPLATIEGNYSSLAHQMLKQYQAIADIIDIILNPSEDAITVAELESNYNKDWVITQKFIVTIRFVSEPEEPLDNLRIAKVNLGLYRGLLDGSNEILDWTYSTPEVLVDESDNGLVDEQGSLLI